MTRTKIKFCGMTRTADIVEAERLSADFIGFVFVPSSPRYIDLKTAHTLRDAVGRARTVGIFENTPLDEITSIASILRLDFVQIYDSYDLSALVKITTPVIKAFRGVPKQLTAKEYLSVCPFILIDKPFNGRYDPLKITSLPLSIRAKTFIAGGLSPDNVAETVTTLQPFAVDVARGIEHAPGIKDTTLMQRFVATVHNNPYAHAR